MLASVAAVVTNVNDSGAGSLRAAILATDGASGPNQITFNIPGNGVHTIHLQSALPAVTTSTSIDGSSQPGFSAAPLIELDGTSAGASNGLTLWSGTSTVKDLIINRFNGTGIYVGSSGNLIVGNFIGTASSGTAGRGNASGMQVWSSGNTIGGLSAGAGNLISGNTYEGIMIDGTQATANLVLGNRIGTALGGDAAIGNGYAAVSIRDGATANTVGGSIASASNLLSGNGNFGVVVFGTGTTENLILGNEIGTNLAGTAAIGNGYGVGIYSPGNTIGGTAAGAGNVISGNNWDGIYTDTNGSSTVILGNKIGVEVDGKTALGNLGNGMNIETGQNTIGGTAAGAGNVVSANAQRGILLGAPAFRNLVEGNLVGTTADGGAALGNAWRGIEIEGNNNTVGGTAAGAGNLVSGNTNQGILLYGTSSTGNLILGNRIGTDVTGTIALPNAYRGVIMQAGANRNTIGGTAAGAGNLISGNGADGVEIADSGSDNNVVMGNLIGTTADGLHALGNYLDGVLIYNSATGNTVGGTAAGAGNVIASNFIGIGFYSASGNAVMGNLIGLGRDGNTALGNATSGVQVDGGSSNTTIGGTAAGAGNVISANQGHGVLIEGTLSTGNLVLGNRIGTDATGTMGRGNADRGVIIMTGASQNTIGGTAQGAGNLISANGMDGIAIANSGSNNNVVLGNLIGTQADGLKALGNSWEGVVIFDQATGNTIGGSAAGSGNVVSANLRGVWVTGASGNAVMGNLIGLGKDGRTNLGNRNTGVEIDSSSGVTIGGTAAGAGNVIGWNSWFGILLQSSDAGLIAGNFVGTDATGNAAAPNQQWGLWSESSNGVTIGGTVDAARNVISGNAGGGGAIFGDDVHDLIQGNRIGTNADGTAALPNQQGGFSLWSNNNTIGGTTPAAGNLISGNGYQGLLISYDGSGNLVEGNRIGTNADGTSAIGNQWSGITVWGSGNTIGGTVPGAGNIISGNGTDGILFETIQAGNHPMNNVIEGNRIGTDTSGILPVPNLSDGIQFHASSLNSTVGGTAAGMANIIAFNGGNGVTVGSSTTDMSQGISILGNSVFSNAKLGIDLGDDGVTPNGANGHAGPNLFQNFPVLTAAVGTTGTTTIAGYLAGTPGQSYRIEIFNNPTADPTGYGQGEQLVASGVAVADASGLARFTFTAAAVLPAGSAVSATATDSAGNTSEFSADAAVVSSIATTVSVTSSKSPSTYGDSVTFTAALSPSIDGLPALGGTVQFVVDGSNFGPPVPVVNGAASSPSTSSLGAGSHSVQAIFSGSGVYAPSQATITQWVNRAVLIVTATDQDISRGDAIPPLTYTISGFVNGEGASAVAGAPLLAAPGPSSRPAGIYPITISQGSLTAANYTFSLVPGALTVHPKVVDVRVHYGAMAMSLLNLNRDLPFININAIDIVFSDDVSVPAGALALVGTSGPYSFSGFSYNPATRDATWDLPTAIGVDELLMVLDGTSPGGVHTVDPTIPMLANFRTSFRVLPGDFNGDGSVNSNDMVGVRDQIVGIGPIDLRAWADLDGNGVIDIQDYNAVKKRIGTHLS